MRRWVFALLLLLPQPLFAAGLSVVPQVIPAGGVALLRWKGPPPSVAVGRFEGESFYLIPDEDGATALLGVDLNQAPGTYPVTVALTDSRGETTLAEATLGVRQRSRPVERLTLPQAMVSPQNPETLRRIKKEVRLLNGIFARVEPGGALERFVLPVADPLGSLFGLRRILNGEEKAPHSGVDFRSPKGTAVRAPSRGRVVFAGDLYYTGKTVILDHGEGLYSYYAHLETIACHREQRLHRGEILGAVGESGRATGPHLHWGVKLRNLRVDPLALVALPLGEKP